jgi:hypothetical protein
VWGEGTGRTRDLRTPVRVRAQTDLDLWSRGRCLLISYPLLSAIHSGEQFTELLSSPPKGLSALYCGSVRSPLRVGLSALSLRVCLSALSLRAGREPHAGSLPGWWVSLGRPRIDFGPLIYKQE